MIELFKWKEFKLPKIVFRKLGKEQSWGRMIGNLIEIDSRLKGKKLLEITNHEFLHWLYPDKTEEDVIKEARMITEYLWKNGYRKVDHEE